MTVYAEIPLDQWPRPQHQQTLYHIVMFIRPPTCLGWLHWTNLLYVDQYQRHQTSAGILEVNFYDYASYLWFLWSPLKCKFLPRHSQTLFPILALSLSDSSLCFLTIKAFHCTFWQLCFLQLFSILFPPSDLNWNEALRDSASFPDNNFLLPVLDYEEDSLGYKWQNPKKAMALDDNTLYSLTHKKYLEVNFTKSGKTKVISYLTTPSPSAVSFAS